MRSIVAATIAIVLAMAATTASAGVVIYQDVVTSDQAGEHRDGQSVMIQGHKQKVVTEQREYITDLDAGKIYILIPSKKIAGMLPFPPIGIQAAIMARDGVFVGIAKASGTNKVAGYDCQNYAGSWQVGHNDIKATECVASAAAGAKEYADFRRALQEKVKSTPLKFTGEIPDGIPVSSTVTAALIPFPIPPTFSPEQVAAVKAANAKSKPVIKTTTVTKIETRDLPAETFKVPADWKQPKGLELPLKKSTTPQAAPAPAPASSPAGH